MGPLAQDSGPGKDRSRQQEDQDEFGKGKGDIRRKISPRQVGRGDEPSGEQSGEWKGLMRKEGEGTQRVLDRADLSPGPEYQHGRVGKDHNREKDARNCDPSAFD